MMTMLILFCSVLILLLFRNISFVLFWAPSVRLFFFLKKRKNTKKKRGADSSEYADNGWGNQNLLGKLILLYSSAVSYYLYRVSMTPSHHIRNFVYRNICGMRLESNAVIYYGVEVRCPERISIGKGAVVGDKSILDGRNGIEIDDNAVLGSCVNIWTQQHDHRDPWFRCSTQEHFPVKIGKRAWVGSHCIILHSVNIGEAAVVAAGSVVTHDVPPFSIVAGVPAKVIGERQKDLRYTNDGSHRMFI